MWFLNGERKANNATKWLPWCGMVDLQSGKSTKSLSYYYQNKSWIVSRWLEVYII